MVDPLAVTSSQSTGSASAGSKAAIDGDQLNEDLQYFLTLLTTQLQNQNPLDPLDTNEFTAQLVQFASVEQQIQQNANLEALLAVQENTQVSGMVAYLGTLAEANGNVLPLTGGHAEASYTLGENATSTTIAIRDGGGRVVFTASGATSGGTHSLSWNGTDSQGNTLPDGAYSLEVVASRADGTFVDVSTTVFGRVTGASVEGDQVVLSMGDIRVPMSSVLSVKEVPPAPTPDEAN